MTRSICAFAIAIGLWVTSTSIGIGSDQNRDGVLPLNVELSYTRQSSMNAWLGVVSTATKQHAYELRVGPELDTRGEIVAWDVSLYDAERRGRNMLAPRGQWHGLQAFTIAAGDLKLGAEKSAFGSTRTIKVEEVGAAVRIQIVDADVTSGDDPLLHRFESLRLRLSVE